MKSTKITTALVLLVTISTALTAKNASERYNDCRDSNGTRVICGTETAVVGAGKTAGDAVEGAANILTLGGVSRAKERDRKESEAAKVCKHGNKKSECPKCKCEHGKIRGKCSKCKKAQEEMNQDEMDEVNGE